LLITYAGHYLLRLKLDRQAVTAIEYSLMASLVAMVIVGSVTPIGSHVASSFNKVSSEL
jgi:pilus assembly protein Flp/PilA